ncbi:MAG: hypothetical protein V1492_03720, partial [Candidatus Micrarchaeota archaeon]
YYPGECSGNVSDERIRYFCANYVHLVPTYCAGNVELANGQQQVGTYYINETYPNGDLKVNKGFIAYPFLVKGTFTGGDLTGITMIYTKDKVWLENGQIVDGYADRKGDFYDSNLYTSLMLNEVEGFDQVYDNGAVKIYKLRE